MISDFTQVRECDKEFVQHIISKLNIPDNTEVKINKIDFTKEQARFSSFLYSIEYDDINLILKGSTKSTNNIDLVTKFIRENFRELVDIIILPTLTGNFNNGIAKRLLMIINFYKKIILKKNKSYQVLWNNV